MERRGIVKQAELPLHMRLWVDPGDSLQGNSWSKESEQDLVSWPGGWRRRAPVSWSQLSAWFQSRVSAKGKYTYSPLVSSAGGLVLSAGVITVYSVSGDWVPCVSLYKTSESKGVSDVVKRKRHEERAFQRTQWEKNTDSSARISKYIL